MKVSISRLSPWTKSTVAISAFLVIVMAFMAVAIFGSVSVALAYVSGERLIVDSASKSFGTVEAGEHQKVTFSVLNRTGHSVTLIGSRSSCGCTVATDLPMSLPPRSSCTLPVVVKTDNLSGEFETFVKVFSDAPERGTITLRVHGRIRQTPSSK